MVLKHDRKLTSMDRFGMSVCSLIGKTCGIGDLSETGTDRDACETSRALESPSLAASPPSIDIASSGSRWASACDVAEVAEVLALSTSSFLRAASLSMPFFLRKTFIVVRKALFGLQSSALTGSCRQTGQA